MRFLKNNYVLLAIILLSYWAVKSLFVPGFFPIHDDEQIARLFDLDQALKFGQIPPRIAPNLGFGYGYPFFNFYPPLAYYIAEIFKVIGFSYIGATKLMVGLGFILGSFFMYLLSKEFFGKSGGLISAVFYTYAPYHAVDVYIRGAFPEFWSTVFLPAIFWAFYKIKQDYRWNYSVLCILFISLLILSHNLVMLMAAPYIVAWIVFLTFGSKNKKSFLLTCLIILVSSFLLTSYFWIPSFFEKQYTMVNLLTTELANYSQHFVCLQQFWNSPWGYGGSVAGCIDGMSFQLGKIHIALSLLALILAIRLLIVKKTKIIGVTIIIFIAFLIFSIFMATSYSQFIWDRINFLWYIQFPWRFLIFSSFFSSFLVGSLFLIPVSNRIKIFLAVIIILVLIWKNQNYFLPSKFLLSVKDPDYISQEIIRWDTSILSWEYVPKGVTTKKSNIDTTVIDINKEDIAKKSYQVVEGDMVVKQIQDFPQEKKYIASSSKVSILRINTYSFPGWKVYVDGKQVAYTNNNKLKLITLSPLVGYHTVLVEFTDTKIRSWGNSMSLISIVSLIIFSLLNIIKDLNLRKVKTVL
jgi:uncharacterized membrane protein